MLVFLDTTGAVTATAPSTTGRNSAAMSTIYIVAPISGAAMISLSFRLPNGDEVNPTLADKVHNAVEILAGIPLPASVRVWSYAIPASVTRIAGTVTYTITTHTESMTGTGSGTFVVAPATTKTLPSSAPGVDVWHEIITELARIYAEMETVLGKSPVKGLDGLSTTVTALISKIAALIGNEPIESPIGGATTISTLLDWLKDESVRFSAVIGGGSISFAGSLIEAVNTLREISVGKTSDPGRVYATASDGSPAFLPYAESPTAYSVPQRDGAGRVKTASPASASDAVDFSTFSADKERVGKLITDLQTAVNRLSRAFAFDNWEAALVELTKPALAEAKEKYKIGDAVLIRDVEAPDGWVSGYAVSPLPYPGGNNVQNPFDGTDAFTVGWLIISPLEAPKLSLDGYATTEEAKAFADAAESEAKSYAAEEVAGVSDRVDILDKKVAGVSDRVDILDKKVAGVSDRVDILDKKVENLRADLSPEYFVTDSSVAYVKEVPAAALPFAEVKEVGGMSYAEGGEIKNAAVTALETVGYNILDLTPALNANLTDNGDGTYTFTKTANGRFSESFPLYIPKGQQVFCYLEIVSTNIDGLTRISLQLFGADKNDNGASIGIVNGGAAYAPTADTFFANAYLQANDAVGAYVTFRNPMIKYGKSAEFRPYSKHTYPVPAEVKALDGWGMGVNETYHNRLDWTKKQYRQEVGTVDMGDLTYSMRVSNERNVFGTADLRQTIRGFAAGDAPLPAVATGYRAVRVADTWVDGDMAYGSNAEGYTSIEFVNNAYTDAASFKEAMRGRKLVYALAKPIVTDLPDLPDDNFIEVEGGGTITAVNEYALAAPTKIEYQLKEATA